MSGGLLGERRNGLDIDFRLFMFQVIAFMSTFVIAGVGGDVIGSAVGLLRVEGREGFMVGEYFGLDSCSRWLLLLLMMSIDVVGRSNEMRLR